MSTPFKIDVSAAQLESVKAHFRNADLTAFKKNLLSEPIDAEDFRYGLPPILLEGLIDRFNNGYSWEEWQDKLNAMGEHRKLKVTGVQDEGEVTVHFVICKSKRSDAKPLLFSHGWPGSFMEALHLAPVLTDPPAGQPAFHVVVPSIPGYVFSDSPRKPFWNISKTAYCFDQVMQHLGHAHYYAQGGDWGSDIVIRLAQMYGPSRVLAIHLNFVIENLPCISEETEGLSELEHIGLERRQAFLQTGIAYGYMQGTVPYTIGAVLSLSPVALLAYIAEKMYRWSSPTSHPSQDEILTNVLLYWFSGSITSSFWLYYSQVHHEVHGSDIDHILKFPVKGVPAGVSFGRYDLQWPPERDLKKFLLELKSYKVLEGVGHFFALENAPLLANEVQEFFGSL